jgi:hypothetical protein
LTVAVSEALISIEEVEMRLIRDVDIPPSLGHPDEGPRGSDVQEKPED